jgi:hypothetical protein
VLIARVMVSACVTMATSFNTTAPFSVVEPYKKKKKKGITRARAASVHSKARGVQCPHPKLSSMQGVCSTKLFNKRPPSRSSAAGLQCDVAGCATQAAPFLHQL